MYQVWPLLPSHQPTIIYGQGGIGKSWLAAYLCALVDNRLTVNGLSADYGRSLYVDWETDKATIEGRAWGIKQGEPQIAPDWALAYQRAHGPLVEWIDELATHVEREQFDLVVLDSVGLALGGDANDAQTVLAFFDALRQLEATTLLIDHMTKGSDSQERGVFGSAYKRNSARSLWEMRQAEGELTMGLYHRKANNSKLSPPPWPGARHRRGRQPYRTGGDVQPMRRCGPAGRSGKRRDDKPAHLRSPEPRRNEPRGHSRGAVRRDEEYP